MATKSFGSSENGYDPKLHLRFRLDPIDLCGRQASGFLNFVLPRPLRQLVAGSDDPVMRRFANFDQLWGD
jgi:hypothetical protein